MDAFPEMLSRGVGELLGRASGPLHFRLFVMPVVVTVLGIRSGLRDAREGRPLCRWFSLTDAGMRSQFIRSVVSDLGTVFVVAVVLDTTYQIAVLRQFRLLQMLIVVVATAVAPYILIRGPVTLVARRLGRHQPGHA